LIKSFDNLLLLIPDASVKLEYEEGSDSYTKGNRFIAYYQKYLKATYVVEEVIDEDNYKKLSLNCIKIVPWASTYLYNYILYRCTNNNNTLFTVELVYHSDPKLSPDHYKLLEKDREDFLKSINSHLSANIENLYQIESVILESSLEEIWNIISNWKTFKNLVPIIAEKSKIRRRPHENKFKNVFEMAF